MVKFAFRVEIEFGKEIEVVSNFGAYDDALRSWIFDQLAEHNHLIGLNVKPIELVSDGEYGVDDGVGCMCDSDAENAHARFFRDFVSARVGNPTPDKPKERTHHSHIINFCPKCGKCNDGIGNPNGDAMWHHCNTCNIRWESVVTFKSEAMDTKNPSTNGKDTDNKE